VTQNIRDCATNQQINSVIPNSEHSGGFVYYILSLNAERIAKLAGIQAVPIINKTQFSAVRLLVPESSEQDRIANCLSSLDDFIAAQSRKIDVLMIHKKGLMEQLFPVMSEVG
jgi:type I restriction enzyme S subunit